MHEYDVTLKMLLRGSPGKAIQALTGISVHRWLDIELPKIQNLRLDLLGQSVDGRLSHLEVQSRNDSDMSLRMLEYSVGVYRLFKVFPRQIVLYVGTPPLRMASRLEGPGISFSYELIDMRDLDGDVLLASEQVGDNVLAILTRLRDQRAAVREVVHKICLLEDTQRGIALRQLLILAGRRGLEEVVEREIAKMPITVNILENKVLGREFKRGIAEGELNLLRLQIEKRFGPIPLWAKERLSNDSALNIEAVGLRLLDALSLEDLLK